MRIAIISEHASPLARPGSRDSGGQNIYVNAVARRLAARGHLVDVFTRRNDPSLPPEQCLGANLRVVNVPAGPAEDLPKELLWEHMPAFRDFILGWCRDQAEPYAVVHANFWMSAWVAAELKEQLGLPFAVTFHALGRVRRVHQGDSDAFPDERFAVEQRTLDEADRVIAECPQDVADMLTHYRLDMARTVMVPCGFDPAEFAPGSRAQARRTLGLPQDEPVVLQLGRIVPRKGIDNVIEGVGELRRRHGLSARLLVVGGERDSAEVSAEFRRLQGIAAAAGVCDLVTFAGRRERAELAAYYRAADVFVTTPWYEPFGITPLEAMACARPVVGADVGGIRYSVADGVTGFLVPPRDPVALAERLARLLRDPELAERMGAAGLQRARACFTWDSVASRLEEVLQAIARAPLPRVGPERTLRLELDRRAVAVRAAAAVLPSQISAAAAAVARAFRAGNRLYICGNGGSAAEAQHFATELTGRFQLAARPGLPAMALTADTSFITAWSNDFCFDDVFARQVEAYGRPGDVLVGISTSGRSPNILRALSAARAQGLVTIGLLGGEGGPARELCDLAVLVPAPDTQVIQEVQLMAIHLLCGLVEDALAAPVPAARRTGHARRHVVKEPAA